METNLSNNRMNYLITLNNLETYYMNLISPYPYYGKVFFFCHEGKLRQCRIVKLEYEINREYAKTYFCLNVAGIGAMRVLSSVLKLYASVEDFKKDKPIKNYSSALSEDRMDFRRPLLYALGRNGENLDQMPICDADRSKRKYIMEWEWDGAKAVGSYLKVPSRIIYDGCFHFDTPIENNFDISSIKYLRKRECEEDNEVIVEYLDDENGNDEGGKKNIYINRQRAQGMLNKLMDAQIGLSEFTKELECLL